VTSSAGETVHVDRRCDRLHRARDVDVVVAVEVGVNAALQAYLGGAALDGLDDRRCISSISTRYGLPRRLSDSGPFENAQKRHLNVHTFV